VRDGGASSAATTVTRIPARVPVEDFVVLELDHEGLLCDTKRTWRGYRTHGRS